MRCVYKNNYLSTNHLVDAWFHAEQRSNWIHSPDKSLVDSECYSECTDQDNQNLDWKTDLPLDNVEGDENDHRLVEKEEGITLFTAIPELFVSKIKEAYPGVENDQRPAPGVDTV